MSESSQYWKKPPDQHTKIKSEIVTKYFQRWTKVIQKTNSKIAYIDLYAGRGEHRNGELSTGMEIVSLASKDAHLCNKLVIILNDVKKSHCKNIVEVIERYGYRRRFSVEPKVTKNEVNDLLAEYFNKVKLVPTFFFIDPYGYKGLTIDLIKGIIKDWGSDCVVFFHTSGINRNIMRRKSEHDMRMLFGDKHYSRVIQGIAMKNNSREATILEEFKSACADAGAKFILAMRFNFSGKSRISHHLIFLTKHPLGFKIMKEVMYKCSIKQDSIPLYEYFEDPKAEHRPPNLLFNEMENLKNSLLMDFSGKTITVKEEVVAEFRTIH